MAQPAKYLFDRNLDACPGSAEPSEVALERTLRQRFEEELDQARRSEYERGRGDGEQAAQQSIEAETAAAVADLLESLGDMQARLAEEGAAIRAEAVKVAVAAAEVLAGELVGRQPTALVESLFSHCLEHLEGAPHVALRVNDTVAAALQERVGAIAEHRGFAGRIIVLGDPETRRGDCRIEWADGGMARDFEQLRLTLADIVQRHVGAPRPVPANGKASPPSNGAAAAEARPAANGNGAPHPAGRIATPPDPVPAPQPPSPASPALPAQAAGGTP